MQSNTQRSFKNIMYNSNSNVVGILHLKSLSRRFNNQANGQIMQTTHIYTKAVIIHCTYRYRWYTAANYILTIISAICNDDTCDGEHIYKGTVHNRALSSVLTNDQSRHKSRMITCHYPSIWTI